MTLATGLLALLALQAPDRPAPLPSPKEVAEGFRKNADAFRTLKVKWSREHHRLDAWGVIEAKRQAEEDARLAKLIPESPEFIKAEQEMGERRAGGQPVGPTAIDQTFLTDRVGFQIRSLTRPTKQAPDEATWKVPDDEPYAPTLTSGPKAPTLLVISFSGNPNDGYRYWMAQPSGLPGFGQIMAGMPTSYRAAGQDSFPFPPLGAAGEGRGEPTLQWNPIDAFFHLPVETLKVVGRETIDGRETVVVENTAVPPPFVGRATPGGPASVIRPAQAPAQAAWIDRAYLDPARGWLPLRIERHRTPKPPGGRESRPIEVVEGVEIAEIPGAGFYPMKGARRILDEDPDWKGEPGKGPGVPVEETIWRVVKLDANAPLRENFRLPFPKGIQYMDQRTGGVHVAGQEGWEGTFLPWMLCLGLLAGWAVFGLVVAAGGIIRRSRRPGALTRPARVH